MEGGALPNHRSPTVYPPGHIIDTLATPMLSQCSLHHGLQNLAF